MQREGGRWRRRSSNGGWFLLSTQRSWNLISSLSEWPSSPRWSSSLIAVRYRVLEWRAKRCYRRVDCVKLSVDHPTLRQPAALLSGEREERLRRTRKSEWWLLFLWGQCLSEYSSHPVHPSEETRFSSLFSGAPLLVPSLRISEKKWSQWVRAYSRWTLVEEDRPWWDSSRKQGSCLSLPSPLLLSSSLSKGSAASS